MWPLSACEWLRTMVNLSLIFAHCLQCSVKITPGDFVEIVLNGPRISMGASGLGSHMSCCGGPPSRKMKMQDFALALIFEALASVAAASACNSFGRVSP